MNNYAVMSDEVEQIQPPIERRRRLKQKLVELTAEIEIVQRKLDDLQNPADSD